MADSVQLSNVCLLQSASMALLPRVLGLWPYKEGSEGEGQGGCCTERACVPGRCFGRGYNSSFMIVSRLGYMTAKFPTHSRHDSLKTMCLERRAKNLFNINVDIVGKYATKLLEMSL